MIEHTFTTIWLEWINKSIKTDSYSSATTTPRQRRSIRWWLINCIGRSVVLRKKSKEEWVQKVDNEWWVELKIIATTLRVHHHQPGLSLQFKPSYLCINSHRHPPPLDFVSLYWTNNDPSLLFNYPLKREIILNLIRICTLYPLNRSFHNKNHAAAIVASDWVSHMNLYFLTNCKGLSACIVPFKWEEKRRVCVFNWIT